jgi:uncharacterized protein (TIRG00374 family)
MKGRYRWVLQVLRWGICVALIAYLVTRVPWYDHVRLADAEQTRARLLEVEDDQFIVELDGETRKLPSEAIRHVEVGGQLVPDIEPGFPTVLVQTDKRLAIWSILLFAPVPLLAAIRLTWMLRVRDVHLSIWNSVKLTFAGNFFNFALPGMTGGDLVKAYYVTRFTKRKTEAVTLVFLDRVIGLMGFVFISSTMIIFARDPGQFRDLAIPLLVIVSGLVVGGTIVFSSRIRKALRFRALLERLPLSAQLQRVAEATLAMREHKLLVTLSLAITLVLQCFVLASAAVMAWALHMNGTFTYFFVYVAIGFLIAALPTAPQGLGVVESAYVLFFTYGGQNTASQAVALALLVRLIQLVWAVPGVLVPLLGAHVPNRSELEKLENLEAPPAAPAEPGGPSEVSTSTPQ